MATETTRKWLIAALLIASIAGVGGAVYYHQTARRPPRAKPKSAKKPAAAPPKDEEQPLKSEPTASAPAPAPAQQPETRVAAAAPEAATPSAQPEVPAASIQPDQPAPAPEAAAPAPALSKKERAERANELKNKGNEAFKNKDYVQAIDQYTQAIELDPKKAVFWCNRAACYANLNQNDKVIADCNEALKLDPVYLKAFQRRANAYEQSGQLREALADLTAVVVLDGYKSQNIISSAERILKQLAEAEADELPPRNTPSLPSSTFISGYMDAFRPIEFDAGEDAEEGSLPVLVAEALVALKDKDFDTALDATERAAELAAAIEDSESELAKVAALAYNLHGSFLFLKGQIDDAASAYEKSLILDSRNINTMIKASNILMEKGDAEATLATFDKAIEIDAENPEIYYHRGQIRFLLNDFPGALADYQKSIELADDFPVAHVQAAVCQYKLGSIQTAMATFKRALQKFPTTADVHQYYGEILMDQGRFDDATAAYEKAISLSPNAPMAYMNKASIAFQVRQDPTEAERLLRMALERDPKCDLVYLQLANLLLPLGKADEARELLDRAIELARTRNELVNAVMAKENLMAQYAVSKMIPAHLLAQHLK